MLRIPSLLVLTLLSALPDGLCQTTEAPQNVSEIETLKRRVAELEQQNRQILSALKAISAKVGVSESASEIQLASAPVAATIPAPLPAAPSQNAVPASNTSQANWPQLTATGTRLKFYGLLRLDLDVDSERPNAPQGPLWIQSADPKLGGKPDAGNFSIHPRLTRFGVDYSGPKVSGLADADLSGKLEMDFENGGSESRQIIRIRHAYMQLKKDDLTILAGQTWDVFSPLFPTVNNDTLLWDAGNLGDRRPQFRVSYDPKLAGGRFSFTSAVGLTGAVDAQDLDSNGYRDGEESGKPDVQARVGYARSLWVSDKPASLGGSMFYGWLNTSKAIGGLTSFHAQVVNIDYTLPLAKMLQLQGEGWWGRNMSDIRGGAGQGINAITGRSIRGRGLWSELTVRTGKFYSIHPGFSTDDPVASDVAAGGRTRNQVAYVGNRFTPGGNLTIGLDYLRWWTSYKGNLPGVDNRINIFFQYAY